MFEVSYNENLYVNVYISINILYFFQYINQMISKFLAWATGQMVMPASDIKDAGGRTDPGKGGGVESTGREVWLHYVLGSSVSSKGCIQETIE